MAASVLQQLAYAATRQGHTRDIDSEVQGKILVDASRADIEGTSPFQIACARYQAGCLSRSETHDPVHCTFINLMKILNEGTLILNKVPSNHFMF